MRIVRTRHLVSYLRERKLKKVTFGIESTNWKENLFPVAPHFKSHFKRSSSFYVSARLLCLRCILILSLAINFVLFFLLFLLSFAVFRFV